MNNNLIFHRHTGTGFGVFAILRELDLSSLRKVHAGNIVIISPNICYIKPNMFKNIVSNPSKQSVFFKTKDPEQCSMYLSFEDQHVQEC